MSAPTRTTDPETSREAGESVNVSPSMRDVVDILTQWGPRADHELVSLMESLGYRHTPQRIRTARSALVAAGRVKFTGQYRDTYTGRSARVWAVVS